MKYEISNNNPSNNHVNETLQQTQAQAPTQQLMINNGLYAIAKLGQEIILLKSVIEGLKRDLPANYFDREFYVQSNYKACQKAIEKLRKLELKMRRLKGEMRNG